MATSSIEKVTNNSGSNYCKMPDGTLIQWGTAKVNANAYAETVTFPMGFVDTSYDLQFTAKESQITVYIGTKSATNSTFGRDPVTAENNFDWIAIGRWK